MRIAFLGDSLTRYQYLDLLYYIKFGKWIQPTSKTFLTYQPRHKKWKTFFNFSSAMFRPEEQCDCFRQEEGIAWAIGRATENYYYWNPLTNNSIAYFQKFDDKLFKSY